MSEEPKVGRIDPAALAERIRETSRAGSLMRLSALKREFPEDDPELLVSQAQADDIKKIAGSRDEYYFSEKEITAAYALHLFRVEERDPVRLVADTVRDESRIYPRPTYARTFLEPPFSMRQNEFGETLNRIAMRPDTADIKTCRTSNGVLFLYSSEFLGENHAQGLAEFIEVIQKENP